MFISGIFIMRWFAIKKDWDDSYVIPIKVNLVWLIFFFILGFFLPLEILIVVLFILDFILGTFLVMRYYSTTPKESALFVLIILVIYILIFIAILLSLFAIGNL